MIPRFYQYFFLICVCATLVFSSFSEDDQISPSDIDYVESLKVHDPNVHLALVDSVLTSATHNPARIALLHLKKGILLAILQRDQAAIEQFLIGLEYFEKVNSKPHMAKSYWLLGVANLYLSNKILANEQLLKALQISQESDDKKMQANIYTSLGHTYFLYKEYQKTVEYTLDALQIFQEINDTLGMSSAYNNLGISYKHIGDYKSAVLYNTKALKLSQLRYDTISIAKSHNNIGSLESLLGDTPSAIMHFKKAISINEQQSLLNSSSYQNLADLYLEDGNLLGAREYYTLALDIEILKGNLSSKIHLNNKLLEVSLQEKNFESAIAYQKEIDVLTNLQLQKENEEKLISVENQYKLAASQQELFSQQNINQKNQIIFLIVLSVLFLLVLSWLLYTKTKRLELEKEAIHLEQKVLRSQMNPHFIFNVLSSIQNSMMDNDPIKSATHLSRFAKLFRQNFDFIDRKSITLRDETEVLDNYISAQQLRYKDKFEYKLNVDKNINIDEVEIPPLLLQPFLENAIEHGFKNKKDKGLINLNISENRNTVWYEVTDNGKGYDVTKTHSDLHALDIFKKRLKLLENGDEKTLTIQSSDKGTSIKFGLKND